MIEGVQACKAFKASDIILPFSSFCYYCGGGDYSFHNSTAGTQRGFRAPTVESDCLGFACSSFTSSVVLSNFLNLSVSQFPLLKNVGVNDI